MGNIKGKKRKIKRIVKAREDNDKRIIDNLDLGPRITGNAFTSSRLNYNDATAKGYSYSRLPKKPIKLEVGFPMMSDNTEITQSKLNRLLDTLKRMSNGEFSFVFNSNCDFLEIIPDDDDTKL